MNKARSRALQLSKFRGPTTASATGQAHPHSGLQGLENSKDKSLLGKTLLRQPQKTMWATCAICFWLHGLHRVSLVVYWGCGPLGRGVLWSVRTMASCVWGLGGGRAVSTCTGISKCCDCKLKEHEAPQQRPLLDRHTHTRGCRV